MFPLCSYLDLPLFRVAVQPEQLEPQLLREAVMLRQQREIAEYVRDTIRAEKAAGGPKTPPTELGG